MKRSTFILLVALVIAALAASLLIQRRAGATEEQNETSLRQQQEEIERAAADNREASNGIAQAAQTATMSAGTDYTAELTQLRTEAAALRAQEIQVSNQQWNIRVSTGVHFLSTGISNLLDHNQTVASTVGGGPRADKSKLNDARAFTAAIRRYADEHQGAFPSTLDQVAAFLPKPLNSDSPGWANAPVSGTNEFEIVYQGATNELGNIPPRRVALIRERQPWLTTDGKWARTYAFADGGAEIVVSDDNFQSWEVMHVVPPPANP